MIFSVRRPKYFISQTKSQRSPVMRNRLLRESKFTFHTRKVNLGRLCLYLYHTGFRDFEGGADMSKFPACTVTQRKIKIQTIQYRRTRIWEMKKDEYTKTLAKNQVSEIFQMRDIGKNGLPKFIKLCMETPCWCPFQEHQYGRRIPTETSVFEFSY